MATMKQGEDLDLELEIIRNGVPVVLTTNLSIIAEVIAGGKRAKLYSATPNPDEGDLVVSIVDTNKITLKIRREHSVLFAEGNATINVTVDMPEGFWSDGGGAKQFLFPNSLVVKKGYTLDVLL